MPEKTTQPSLDSRINSVVEGLGADFEIPALTNPGLSAEDDTEEPDDADTNIDTAPERDPDPTSAEKPTEIPSDQAPEVDPGSKSPDVSRLADLAEAEADIRQSRVRLRNAEIQLAEREKAVQDAPKPVDINATIRENPFQALKDAGVPFDHLMDLVVKNEGNLPATTETPKQTSEVSELKEMVQALSKKLDDKDADAEAAKGEDEYRMAVGAVIKDPKYAVLRTMAACEDTVFSLALKHARETGEALPPAMIADKLQERWAENLKSAAADNDARKAMGLDLLDPGQKPRPKPTKQEKPVESETTETTTLTQDGSQVTHPKRSSKGMSREESIAHAAKQLTSTDLWPNLEDEDDDDDD